MTEGTKSRWATRALFSVLAAFAIMAVVPAVAAATPAADEYDLNLPEADGESNDPAPQQRRGLLAFPPSTAEPAPRARHR